MPIAEAGANPPTLTVTLEAREAVPILGMKYLRHRKSGEPAWRDDLESGGPNRLPLCRTPNSRSAHCTTLLWKHHLTCVFFLIFFFFGCAGSSLLRVGFL